MFESLLERDLAYILITNSRVETVYDQPEPIEYADADGQVHKHTFDFAADLKDGTKVAIAVKPAQKIQTSRINETLTQIRAQAPKGIADRFELRTGDHITRDRAYNARLIVRARRTRNEDDIATILAAAATLRGSIKVSALLSATKNDGDGFMAAVCLVGDGVLEHVSRGRFSYNSIVKLA